MKLGNLIARFPHVANLDINDEGQVMLSDAVFEAIVQNEAMRYAAARKIVSIVRHHAERLGGVLSFSYDPYHERERVFAIMETPFDFRHFSPLAVAPFAASMKPMPSRSVKRFPRLARSKLSARTCLTQKQHAKMKRTSSQMRIWTRSLKRSRRFRGSRVNFSKKIGRIFRPFFNSRD